MKQYKYRSLCEVQEAFLNGELDPKSDFLLIDSDYSFVSKETDDGDDIYVFRGGGPRELIEEALEILGIPWERA